MHESAAALLVLADGRFPAGGHAHSAGVEAACARSDVRDLPSLRRFVEGRLHTTGRVDATFAAAAAAATAGAPRWGELDRAIDARIVSPRLRDVSRALGRQLVRAGARVWPHPALDVLRERAPHQPIAMGAVAHAAGLGAGDAALCTLHHLTSAAMSAAVRLLALDPYDVHAELARLAPTLDALAHDAALAAGDPVDELPAWSGPLTEILAEDHATWEVRLFAS